MILHSYHQRDEILTVIQDMSDISAPSHSWRRQRCREKLSMPAVAFHFPCDALNVMPWHTTNHSSPTHGGWAAPSFREPRPERTTRPHSGNSQGSLTGRGCCLALAPNVSRRRDS